MERTPDSSHVATSETPRPSTLGKLTTTITAAILSVCAPEHVDAAHPKGKRESQLAASIAIDEHNQAALLTKYLHLRETIASFPYATKETAIQHATILFNADKFWSKIPSKRQLLTAMETIAGELKTLPKAQPEKGCRIIRSEQRWYVMVMD